MSERNRVSLTFVVNTTEQMVEVNVNEPLQAVVKQVLAKSGNSGRQESDWTLTDAAGTPLDLRQTVGALGLATGTTLFLSLEVGQNG